LRLVYLHGLASGPSSSKARWLSQRFQSTGQTLEIPLLDQGRFEKLTISGQLRVLNELLRGDPASLIGSSLGGYLAALYAASHPEIRRVVLLAPAFGFGRLYQESLGPDRVAAWRRDGLLPIYHYGEERERFVEVELLEDALSYEEEPAFSQPALLFHGLQDDVVPPAVSERYASGRPNVELRLLDSDHQLTDAMESIWPEIRVFLLQT
jgi:pimeloyl-ACP methyl ester carboxylesterase